MTDRELLEAAAKAAGNRLKEDLCGYCDMCSDPLCSMYWNPLERDADAFRLMVDCEVELFFSPTKVQAYCITPDDQCFTIQEYTDHNNDKHAATRRAIVRAAAGE